MGRVGIVPGDRAPGNPLPTVWGGGGDWGPLGLQIRAELWTKTMGLDLMGGVGRP